MSISEQIETAETQLKQVLKKTKFNIVVSVMRNHERNQWARAGYPGLIKKDPTGPAKFISAPRLLHELTGDPS